MEGTKIKYSFSLNPTTKASSKAKSNLKPLDMFKTDEQDDKSSAVKTEFITEFGPSQAVPEKPHRKKRKLEKPVKSKYSYLNFVTDSASARNQSDSTISYGLNLQQPKISCSKLLHVKTEAEFEERRFERPVSVERLILQKLRDDFDRLPEDQGFEEFDEVPVEGFGAALLGRYGWCEGKGIGKNAKEDVKVTEFKQWNGKEGLGFAQTSFRR